MSDIEADNVVRVYYAKDEEGGPDDIPDYAQIVFTYQSADVRKGTVDKSVEIHTFERLNGELLEEKKAARPVQMRRDVRAMHSITGPMEPSAM